MDKNNLFTSIIVVLLIAAVGYILWQNKISKTARLVLPVPVESTTTQPSKNIQITTPLNTPLSGDAVISGVARLVYFEGSFPAKLVDSSNVTVWQGPATAQGDWMVTTDVPFNLTIPTTTIPNGNYTLVMTQDDSSGELPSAELYRVSVPVSVAN